MISVVESPSPRDGADMILKFLRDYGVDRWTFQFRGRDNSRVERLRACLTGIPNRTEKVGRWISAHSNGQNKLNLWEFSIAAQLALADFSPTFLVDHDFWWYFLGKMDAVVKGEPRRVMMLIDRDRQKALFRRGFVFTVEYSNGQSRRFTAADDIGAAPAVSAASTLAEVLTRPYALAARV